jgi:Protein of unknown function (DUF3105)
VNRARALAAAGAVTLLGAGAALALIMRGGDDAAAPPATAPTAAAHRASCREEAYSAEPGPPTGGHPERAFYDPGEAPTQGQLDHVMGDGYVIVRYRADAPQAKRDELAAWASAQRFGVVALPGLEGRPDQVEALTLSKRFVCARLDVEELAGFYQRWLTSPRS